MKSDSITLPSSVVTARHARRRAALGFVTITVWARAALKRTRSNAVDRGASRCSITSTTVAASYPARRLSQYSDEPWISFMCSFCFVGIRSRRRFRLAISRLRYETSMPTISVSSFSCNRRRKSFPFATTQVEHTLCACGTEHNNHRSHALLPETDRLLHLRFLFRVRLFLRIGIKIVFLR